MQFNAQKCEVIHVGRNNPWHEYFMNFQDKIQGIDMEKDLGVIIEKDLKATSHCFYAYNKANRMLGLIERNIKHKCQDFMVRRHAMRLRV